MRMFAWPPLVVAVIYLSLIVSLLTLASHRFDAEGYSYTVVILTTPWIWLVGRLPAGVFAAIILNAATLYLMVALGIAGYRKFLEDPVPK